MEPLPNFSAFKYLGTDTVCSLLLVVSVLVLALVAHLRRFKGTHDVCPLMSQILDQAVEQWKGAWTVPGAYRGLNTYYFPAETTAKPVQVH
jgi:hypothetical protein